MSAPLSPWAAQRRGGFTLLEMMITLAIFLLLAAAVFGIMTGTLQSTSMLEDNQNHRDQVEAFNAFLKKKLCSISARGTLGSYRRGDGEGLDQNGVILGEKGIASALDAKVQPNGLYTLRFVTITPDATTVPGTSMATELTTRVTQDDPTLPWTALLTDVKTVTWQFQDANVAQWVDLWNSSAAKPILVEFTMQLAADLQPSTMDFWLPKVDPVNLNIPAPGSTSGGATTAAPPGGNGQPPPGHVRTNPSGL